MMRETIYELLASDKDVSVRRALAENSAIPENVQKNLSEDINDSVVTALSFNPNLSKSLSKLPRLIELKKNSKSYAVERKVSPRIHLSDIQKNELLAHKTNDALILLSLNSNNTLNDRRNLMDIFKEAVEIDGEKVEFYTNAKVAFLINESTEEGFVGEFEKSSNQSIQEAVAANIKSPLPTLKKLVKKKTEVRCYLANPNWYVPWPFLHTLVDNYLMNGLSGIKKFEQEKINRYTQQLKDSYKPAHVISYKTLILENGGSF